MAKEGWVKIHRKIQDNPLWLEDKFSRGQAWIDLLLLTNHNKGYVVKRGIKVVIERGQCGWSELALSARWKWSRTKVKNFLKLLESEHQIIVEKSKVTQVVTVINYEKYQHKEQQKSNRRATEEQQKNTNKKEKKEKNKLPCSGYSKNFEAFWKEYPNKSGKSKAFASWKRFNCENGIFEEIMKALSIQKKSESWLKDNGRFIPMGSTWVNGKRWEDETEPGTTAQPGGRQWI